MTRRLIHRPYSVARQFFATEASGGIILISASILAMVLANSSAANEYFGFVQQKLGPLSIGHWVNDALMSLFFLLVGLEVKRELLEGELSSWTERRLPAIAATGGVIVPALFYVFINLGSDATLRGWAIPTATDIAFALAIIALLGDRVPVAIKILLTAIAVIDDIIAVTIIGIFYTADLSILYLGLAVVGLLFMAILNRLRSNALWLYMVVGLLVWLAVFNSGIHATLSGVLVAMFIPIRAAAGKSGESTSMLHSLEKTLHPWVAYLVVPLFGFVNAGVTLSGGFSTDASERVTLGVIVGLIAGKQLGIFGSIGMAIAFRWARPPRNSSWLQIYGMASLCGIGFTMSLFIGLLAFGDASMFTNAAKLGILGGSIASALIGFLALRFARSPAQFSKI